MPELLELFVLYFQTYGPVLMGLTMLLMIIYFLSSYWTCGGSIFSSKCHSPQLGKTCQTTDLGVTYGWCNDADNYGPMRGTAAGPAKGTCTNWSWTREECPPETCESVNKEGPGGSRGWGWCNDKDVQGAMRGQTCGPTKGTCNHWVWNAEDCQTKCPQTTASSTAASSTATDSGSSPGIIAKASALIGLAGPSSPPAAPAPGQAPASAPPTGQPPTDQPPTASPSATTSGSQPGNEPAPSSPSTVPPSGEWATIPGNLKIVSQYGDWAWGVNAENKIFQCKAPCTGEWHPVDGLAISLDVGPTNVWAIGTNNTIAYRKADGSGPSWTKVSGTLKSVSVGPSGVVWGINPHNEIYRCDNTNTNECKGKWRQISGTLVQIDTGANEVWGVNSSGDVYHIPVNGVGKFVQVPGKMRQVTVAEDAVYGIDYNGNVMKCNLPCNGTWTKVTGAKTGLASIAASGRQVIGVDKSYGLSIGGGRAQSKS